jgi:hypothetical protein
MRVAVVVLMLVLAVPAQGASQRRAALKLESLAPLVVRGTQFGFREPVVVTYLGSNKSTRTVGATSTRKGRFEASFDVRLDRCTAFTVRASGTRGSRAVLQVEPACDKKRKGPPERAYAIPPKPPSA